MMLLICEKIFGFFVLETLFVLMQCFKRYLKLVFLYLVSDSIWHSIYSRICIQSELSNFIAVLLRASYRAEAMLVLT